MRLADKLGTYDIDPSHLKNFVSTWFEPGDHIVFTGMRPSYSGIKGTISATLSYEEVMNIGKDAIKEMTFWGDRGQMYNVYLGINPVKDPDEITLHKRGSTENIQRMIGCFVDLDVKDGAFHSKEQIYNFLGSLEHQPTIIVDNGVNGGVHAYWKIVREDQDLSKSNEKTLKAWWTYINQQAPCSVDRLTDLTRMSRMPSGIYWPSEGSRTDSVRIHTINEDRVLAAEEIKEITAESVERYERKLDTLKRTGLRYHNLTSRHKNGNKDTKILASEMKKDGFSMDPNMFLTRRVFIEQLINDRMDWADILEPAGWTFLKKQNDGSRVFARPGKGDRSAVVDYTDENGVVSPVMSLLSKSEMTGLLDLYEAAIPLTKYQVLLRTRYQDNEANLLKEYMGVVE